MLPQPAEQKGSGCPLVTCMRPSLSIRQQQFPRGTPHQTRRHSWQCRDRSKKKTPVLLQFYRGQCDRDGSLILRSECMQWLTYFATVFMTSMSDLTLPLAGTGQESCMASDELLNGKYTLPGKMFSKLTLKGHFWKMCHHFHLYRWIKKDICK